MCNYALIPHDLILFKAKHAHEHKYIVKNANEMCIADSAWNGGAPESVCADNKSRKAVDRAQRGAAERRKIEHQTEERNGVAVRAPTASRRSCEM